VLAEGRLRQLGTAAELVGAPSDPFVGAFAGANVLHGVAGAGPDGLTEVRLDTGMRCFSSDEARGAVSVVVYPWEISIARAAPHDSTLNHVDGEIVSLVPLGNRVRVRLPSLTAEITTASSERLGLRAGLRVVATFKATGTRLLPRA
jgi:ABC-type molybdate transport system ATPase subunit